MTKIFNQSKRRLYQFLLIVEHRLVFVSSTVAIYTTSGRWKTFHNYRYVYKWT